MEISYLDTDVTRGGERNPSKWTVRANASLDQVMQGRARPAQLLKSELWLEECFHETVEICALHQLSAKTGIDYGTLCDEFKKLHWDVYREGALIAVSQRLLIGNLIKIRRMPQLLRLICQRLHQSGMSMAQRIHCDPCAHIQETSTIGLDQPRARAVRECQRGAVIGRQDRGDHW